MRLRRAAPSAPRSAIVGGEEAEEFPEVVLLAHVLGGE